MNSDSSKSRADKPHKTHYCSSSSVPTTASVTPPAAGTPIGRTTKNTLPLQEKKQVRRVPPVTPKANIAVARTFVSPAPALVTPQPQPQKAQPKSPASAKQATTTPPPRLLVQPQQATTAKIVYLIRHGESKGQLAGPRQRRSDPSLADCGLSDWGRQQAMALSSLHYLSSVDLVLSSPLTRALQTAVLGFPSIDRIVVHYDLREIGSCSIPENQPRDMKLVVRDLPLSNSSIDTQTFAPKFPWPQHHDRTPKVLRRDQVKQIFQHLAAVPYQKIAVVCHYHVIRAALTDSRGFCCDPNLSPPNAIPLACYLTPQGQLIPCGS